MDKLGRTFAAIAVATFLGVTMTFNAGAQTSAKEQLQTVAEKASVAADKQEITEVERKILAATKTDQVMRFYDQNNIDLYDFVPPLQYKGATAVRGDLDNFFNNATDLQGKFVELVVVNDGKMGMARSIQHFNWKDKDGKPMEATIRVTDVLHKVDGEWKVIHSHVSVPVDPKTGQAQMNLQS
jgi:ketosteroid isomerase-like protein